MIYAAARDGGLPGLPASMRENGCFIGDKRMRQASAPLMDTGGDTYGRRRSGHLEFIPEAPFRKKMHLGEWHRQERAVEDDRSDPFNALHGLATELSREMSEGGDRFPRDDPSRLHAAVRGAEVQLLESEEERLASSLGFAELSREKASDGRSARVPLAPPVRSEYTVDVAERAGKTFEMPARGLEETFEEEGSAYQTSLPAAETEHTDMDVDPSKSERAASDEGDEDSAAQEQVQQVPAYSESGFLQRDGVELGSVERGTFHEFAGNNWSSPAEFPHAEEEEDDDDEDGLGGVERQIFGECPGNYWPAPRSGEDGPRRNRQRESPRNRATVEVIDLGNDSDDEPPIDMHVCDSDGSSTEGTKPLNGRSGQHRHSGHGSSSLESTSGSCSQEDGSDSEDCKVVDSWNQNNGNPRGDVRVSDQPIYVTDGEEAESDSDVSVESDSDVELVAGSQSNIRKMWEAAAMRKRMGRAMQSEGSKANGEHEDTANLDAERPESQGLEESVATSTYHGSPDSKEQTETSDVRVGAEDVLRASDGRQGACSLFEEEEPPTLASVFEVEQPPPLTSGFDEEEPPPLTSGFDETHELTVAREKLKETAHYRMSDAAEWASRQEEIRRQALESQRLRHRKRLEADRKKEMERKQKQRVEDLRQSQKKEEKNMDLKEQLRVQVREELEHIAASCSDLATLLRRLGIPVDGGTMPSSLQVNASYKKALFKFHPDRATKGDPRRQVEAEEKFKLISRMKNTLAPVGLDYGNGFR